MSSFDLYQTVTDQIVAMLEAGVVPWRSPNPRTIQGRASEESEHRQAYRGVNVFLLAFTAFARGYRFVLLAHLQPSEGTRGKCPQG